MATEAPQPSFPTLCGLSMDHTIWKAEVKNGEVVRLKGWGQGPQTLLQLTRLCWPHWPGAVARPVAVPALGGSYLNFSICWARCVIHSETTHIAVAGRLEVGWAGCGSVPFWVLSWPHFPTSHPSALPRACPLGFRDNSLPEH